MFTGKTDTGPLLLCKQISSVNEKTWARRLRRHVKKRVNDSKCQNINNKTYRLVMILIKGNFIEDKMLTEVRGERLWGGGGV